jgi:uncharacterized protein YcbX
MPTVARLNTTPVKGTRLNHPDALRIEPHGAAGDRDFFLVDPAGERLPAKVAPRMFRVSARYDDAADELTFRFEDGSVLSGPAAGGEDALTVDFWGRPVQAHIVPGPWEAAFTAYLDRPARLARSDEPGAGTDVEPLTLVSLASVQELARQGERTALDARRFRMTFELDGCDPHDEDTWAGRNVRIGDVELAIGEPVPRCVITTLGPLTGERDFPTLKVISRYRGVAPRTSPPFGVYARVVVPGVVRVGDPVSIVGAEPART